MELAARSLPFPCSSPLPVQDVGVAAEGSAEWVTKAPALWMEDKRVGVRELGGTHKSTKRQEFGKATL